MWQFYLKILFINLNVCSQLLNLAKKGGGEAITYFLLKVRKKKKKITLDKQYVPIKVHCARINLGFSICV